MKILTKQQLEALERYEYVGGDASLLYKYVFSPLADLSVEWFVPRWVAPNVLTLTGFLMNIIGTVANLWINPTLAPNAPRWVHLLTAITLLTYQNLDNMDGKQARKTGSSSPLGLVLDHGCDSMNIALINMAMVSCFATGWTSTFMIVLMFQFTSFYIQTWEQHYTGAMVLPIVNGVTDGGVVLIMCNLISAWYGSQIWIDPFIDATDYLSEYWISFLQSPIMSETVKHLHISTSSPRVLITPLSCVIILIFVAIGITNCFLAYSVFQTVAKKGLKFLKPIGDFIPLGYFYGTMLIWIWSSPALMRDMPMMVALLVSSVHVECTVHLIITHATASPTEPFSRYLAYCLPYPLLLLAQTILNDECKMLERNLLIGYSVISFLVTSFTVIKICKEISDALGIYILSIGKKPRKED